MGTGASVMSKKLEEERRRQDETTKKAEELVSSAEQRHAAEVARLRSENASLKDHIQDIQWALKQQTELWQQEKAKNVSMAFGRLPLPVLEAATGLSAMQPEVTPGQLLAGAPTLNRTYPMITVACCNVVGFSRLASSLTPSEAITLVDKLHILVDATFAADGLYIVEQVADTCMIVTGLFDTPNDTIRVATTSQKSIVTSEQSRPSTRGSVRAMSFGGDDAGYETRESEDELPGAVERTCKANKATEAKGHPQSKRKEGHKIAVSWPPDMSTNSAHSFSHGKTGKKRTVLSESCGHRAVSSGPTCGNPAMCAACIARASLKLMSSSIDFHVPSRPNEEQLQLRVALHSGPCHVGVAGLRQHASGLSPDALGYSVPPARLAVLGTTPKEAMQLCNTSLALQIRVSHTCRDLLLQSNVKCHLERCPDVPMHFAGGGRSETQPKCLDSYWLVGMETFGGSLPPLDKALPPSEYDSL